MKKVDNQKAIGSFIKKLREKRSLTQEELAEILNTSQSAIARIESGGQNLTAGELLKIGSALDHKIVSLTDSIDFKINGGRKLKGSIKTNPSKNGAMGLLCASLLNKSTTILHGIPRIEEVNRMLEIFSALGVKNKWIEKQTLEINPPKKFNKKGLTHPSVASVRSSLMLIPAMLHNFKSFELLHSGGCKMGERTISAHRYVFEDFGARIKTLNNKYVINKINQRIEYFNSEDPIESMMFISATITTNSKLKVERCPIDFLALELTKLKTMGLKYEFSKEYLALNKNTKLVDITIFPSKLYALKDKVHAQPYPGINSDNLPFFVPIATQAEGNTLVHDWMWENR